MQFSYQVEAAGHEGKKQKNRELVVIDRRHMYNAEEYEEGGLGWAFGLKERPWPPR